MISARELSGTDSKSLLRRRVAGSIARRASVRYRTVPSTAHRLSRTTEDPMTPVFAPMGFANVIVGARKLELVRPLPPWLKLLKGFPVYV